MVVQVHECFPPLVDIDRSKTKFADPVPFLIRSKVSFQVMPCTSPPVMIEQLRVTLEPGSTVIKDFISQEDFIPQEDFISHFMSVAHEASIE